MPPCVAKRASPSSTPTEGSDGVVRVLKTETLPSSSMATLAPIEPGQEGELLPITRYLRERGQQVKAGELIFAQAYLQAVTRAALGILNGYDAVLSPTLASLPVPVGYFDEVDPVAFAECRRLYDLPAGTARGRKGFAFPGWECPAGPHPCRSRYTRPGRPP